MEKFAVRSMEEAKRCREKMMEINHRFMQEMNEFCEKEKVSPLALVELLLIDCKFLTREVAKDNGCPITNEN